MLSAAHVLAMDAKNLLDVIDSIRIRHPEIFLAAEITLSSTNISQLTKTLDSTGIIEENVPNINDCSSNSNNINCMIKSINLKGEWSEQQMYQNLTKITDEQQASLQEEMYVNSIIRNNEGIYDNNNAVNSHLNAFHTNEVIEDQSIPNKGPFMKPPIAAKPGNHRL